jgi:hypothetical protein
LGLSAYPPRIRASFLNRKLRRKIDAELLRFDLENRAQKTIRLSCDFTRCKRSVPTSG